MMYTRKTAKLFALGLNSIVVFEQGGFSTVAVWGFFLFVVVVVFVFFVVVLLAFVFV